MIPVAVFIMCHNEQTLIQATIDHYKRNLPQAKIVILDNDSTDLSRMIAMNNHCDIFPFNTGDTQNENFMLQLRNNIWKSVERGWVIMCDMDEWLDITAEQLQREDENGVNILTVQGYNVVGCSEKEDLSDMDLHSLRRGIVANDFSKRVCFRRPDILEMNYGPGCHLCDPRPATNQTVRSSERVYILRHMIYLGIEFFVEKNKKRYARNAENRKRGCNFHYTLDTDQLVSRMEDVDRSSVEIPQSPLSP